MGSKFRSLSQCPTNQVAHSSFANSSACWQDSLVTAHFWKPALGCKARHPCVQNPKLHKEARTELSVASLSKSMISLEEREREKRTLLSKFSVPEVVPTCTSSPYCQECMLFQWVPFDWSPLAGQFSVNFLHGVRMWTSYFSVPFHSPALGHSRFPWLQESLTH